MKNLSKWQLGSIAGALIVVVAIGLFLQETFAPSSYGVCTVGLNYREQSIFWFGVTTAEGACGNSASGKEPTSVFPGGGGVACGCTVRPGEIATVKWRFDRTSEQFDSHIPPEVHEMKILVPKPTSRSSRYLGVHFLPDNRVVFDWRDDLAFKRIDVLMEKTDGK
jgi:hypothetical protein